MDLRDYLRLLRRNWFLIAASALVCLLLALAFAFTQKPMYSATSIVLVSTGQSTDVNDLTQSNVFAVQAVATYATVATEPIVLEPVISQLNLQTTPAALASTITTDTPLSTSVLSISVLNPSAKSAAQIANSVASSLANVVSQIAPSATRTSDVTITRTQSAVVPDSPVSPKVPLDAALGLIIGIVLGLGLSAVREALGVRIRDSRDVESLTDKPILGSIFYDRLTKQEPIVFKADPRGVAAEAFRSLRTSLHFLEFEGETQTFVITSSVSGEGKSVCAANLAVAIGDAGSSVVVVDADLRRPALAGYFELDPSVGLSDVLVGDVELDTALQYVNDGQVAVLTAGRIPPNPTELVQSKAMIRLIEELRSQFSTVIFDAPPLLPVSDAGILARRTGGAVMIASANKVTRPQLRSALRSLDAIGAKVDGVVMTMVPSTGGDTYGYGAYGAEDKPRFRLGRRRSAVGDAG